MQFSIIATLILTAVASANTQSQKTDQLEAQKYHEQSNCNFKFINNSPEYIAIISKNGTENEGGLANVYKNCRTKCGLPEESLSYDAQTHHFNSNNMDKNLNDTCNRFQGESKQTGDFDRPKYLGSEDTKDNSEIAMANNEFIQESKFGHNDLTKSKCERECFDNTNKDFTGKETKEERLSGVEAYYKLVEDCAKKC